MSPLTLTRQAPRIAAVLIAALGASVLWAGATASAAPDSAEEAKRAVESAERAQDVAQKALEQAQQRRRLARSEQRQAIQRIGEVTVQLQRLQALVSARARSTYMTGSPTSVAAVVGVANVDDLLDKMETIYRLAESSNETLRDLATLQRIADDARRTLVGIEREQAQIEAQMRAQLAKADKLVEDRTRAEALLRARSGALADALATAEFERRNGEVERGAGGLCNLSGVPSAAREIIMRESHGNPYAKNPRSTAFGLGQLLVGNRIRLMGDDYNSTNCDKQYDAFSQYTLGRYGSFSAALAFHDSHGWY